MMVMNAMLRIRVRPTGARAELLADFAFIIAIHTYTRTLTHTYTHLQTHTCTLTHLHTYTHVLYTIELKRTQECV